MMPGYQASDSENAYDFFLDFFFSFRPTDPISGNAFDGKQNKKKGDGLSRKVSDESLGRDETYVCKASRIIIH